MVIILQLLIFAVAFTLRGRYLFGSQLRQLPGTNHLSYTSRHQDRIASRHIGIIQDDGIPFIIKRERWYHGLLKAIGIAAEVHVGDDGFDTKYFITTDHPSHLEAALASQTMIRDLTALFALPIKSVHATRHKLWCVCKRNDLEESESHYDRHRELLRLISARVQQQNSDDGLPVRRPLGVFALFFLAIHAGLITLGILGGLPTLIDSIDTLDVHELLAKGILAGAVVSGLWLSIIFVVFARSSWICWVLMDFVICGLIGFMLTGIFVVREANLNLPQAAPELVRSQVTQKTCTIKCRKSCGKRCTRTSSYLYQGDVDCAPQARATAMEYRKQTDYICRSSANFSYEMVTSGWQGMPHYSFSPELSLFDHVQQGSALAVPINPGAFGLKWIDTDTIQPTE